MDGILATLKAFWQSIVVLGIVGLLGLALVIPRIPENRAWKQHKAATKQMKLAAAKLVEHRTKHGAYPVPVVWVPTSNAKGRDLPGQTTLDVPGFEPLANDPFRLAVGPIRYATAADQFILLSTGPDAKWTLDTRNWRPEMTATDPALAHFTYDPTNGYFSGGDVLLLGGIGSSK